MITLLVVAKAPVPGAVKTRLCPDMTPLQAATLAAAALLDTLDAVLAVAEARPVVALAGSLDAAIAGWEIADTLRRCTVVRQRGATFADRLTNAHLDAAGSLGPILQIGMDTPQITPALLRTGLAAIAGSAPGESTDRARQPREASSAGGSAAIGLAADGGWWALGLQRAKDAQCLRRVAMSTPHTGRDTVWALAGLGLRVARLPVLVDVDIIADVSSVAACAPDTRFARCASELLSLVNAVRGSAAVGSDAAGSLRSGVRV